MAPAGIPAVLCGNPLDKMPPCLHNVFQLFEIGLFNTTNCHLYHYAGNNPVRYVDPDGNAIQVAIVLFVALVGIGLSAYYTWLLNNNITTSGTLNFNDIRATINLNQQKSQSIPFELSISQPKTKKVHLHHAFPKFLGGSDKQKLVPLSEREHINLHKDLRTFLQKYYSQMEPKKGQSGTVIQSQTSLNQRKNAIAQFYLVNYEQYKDAADQFFADNPDTLTDANAIWALEHYIDLHRAEVLKSLIQTPTEE